MPPPRTFRWMHKIVTSCCRTEGGRGAGVDALLWRNVDAIWNNLATGFTIYQSTHGFGVSSFNDSTTLSQRPRYKYCSIRCCINSEFNVDRVEVRTRPHSVETHLVSHVSTSTPAPTTRCCWSSRRSRAAAADLLCTAATARDVATKCGVCAGTWWATVSSLWRQN